MKHSKIWIKLFLWLKYQIMKVPSYIAGFCQINLQKNAEERNASDQSVLRDSKWKRPNRYDRVNSAVLKLIVRKLEKISRGILFILIDATNLGWRVVLMEDSYLESGNHFSPMRGKKHNKNCLWKWKRLSKYRRKQISLELFKNTEDVARLFGS